MAEPKLPAGYIYGLVIAKAIRAVGDMTDQDDPYPDGPPIELAQAVTFTPVEAGNKQRVHRVERRRKNVQAFRSTDRPHHRPRTRC